MTQPPVRVRIAPSPSGYVHVGTARMAICNFLFARHYQGQFLVRIEDTDTERSDSSLVDAILNAFKWLGLNWDGDIVYQSQRLDLYGQYVKQLLESGRAYRDFSTVGELEKKREEARAAKVSPVYHEPWASLPESEIGQRIAAGQEFAVRLRIPDGETAFDDMVSGKLTRSNSEIEDLIIARSDGRATYNLAVVVDDHEMGITHVLRGNDHITNTFKQVQIYQALGWQLPRFGHVPLILRPDKRKVSKRLGDKDVYAYKREGILPEALLNYLSLLGWSPKSDREIFSVQELIDIFDENNFNQSNAVFDEEKLVAFNREHIAKKSDHELAVLVAPMLVDADLTTKYWLETRWEYLRAVIRLLKTRARRLSDFVEMSGYFFSFSGKYDEAAEEKNFTAEAAEILDVLAERFERLEKFTESTVEHALTGLAEERDIKKAKLIHPTRLAVSGIPAGPGLYEMLVVLSQPVVVKRMREAAEYIRSRKS